MESGTIEFKGHKFATDRYMFDYITATAAFGAFTGSLPDGFFLPDVNKKKVPFTMSEAKQFTKLMMDWGFVNLNKYASLERQVLVAQTFEELNSIKEWA